jgi:CheY-like chemotaxis protein/nitrogen-specific signal transduction histidine kinase/HPt (histidine-containing phosphotransfer) domain-containing protein
MAVPLKILSIDDDQIDCIALKRSISQSGIIADVESAYSAKEGFEKILSSKYNLIFLDYMMPDANGISFLKKLRDNGVDTPVIFITSHGDEKIASQAVLGGASDYIPKTLFTPDGISQSIRNAMKLYDSLVLRRKSEQELKINAERLSEAQKLAKIGSWEINLKDEKDFYYSDELLNILEVDKKETLFFDYFKSCIQPEDISIFKKNITKVKSSNSTLHFVRRITTGKGTVKYVKEYLKCLKDEKNKPYKILGTIQDITEQREIELQLIQAKDIAEQSVKIKEQFLANMSHEIRTPMNGIIGFANILEDTKLDSNQKQNVKSIKTASENLMVIINDILDFSKIEANKMTFEAVNFSLSSTIHSVIELLEPKAIEKKIKLLCEIDSDINNFLIGDPTRLSQILINLVGNAIKFTERGHVEIFASQLNETESETSLEFSVIDTGIGIDSNKLCSIFESFNQASNDTTRKYGGTGLGLSITKKLIDLQGGILKVKSELSKGSEFSFNINYIKGADAGTIRKEKKSQQLSSDFLQNVNILLAEDHDLNQLLAISIFEKWNKKIDIAENGKIALEKIKENDYDIVLMDIQMPEMDGHDVTRYIRKNYGAKANIPIIALTAHATIGEEKKCFDAGMNDYLSKPFDSYKLLEKIYQNLKENSKSGTSIQTFENEKLFDLKYLHEFLENDQNYINEMVDLFIKKTPEVLKSLEEANNRNDSVKLKDGLHKLRSSLSLMGIAKGLEIATRIESQIESNPTSFIWRNEVETFISICERAIEELIAEDNRLQNINS